MKTFKILSLMLVLALTLSACGSESPSLFSSISEASESDFNYKFDSATGGMMITKYSGNMTKFRVPETIEDEPVTAIGDDAFSRSSVEYVHIPNNVVTIGASAFQDCQSLTGISLPDGLANIGASAFQGCQSLTSITLPDGLANIGASAFQGCQSLTSITLPNSVAVIGARTFFDCETLTSITLPDSVSEIATAKLGWNEYTALFSANITVSYKGFAYYANEAVTAVALSEHKYEPLQYGGYNWLILERADSKALLLCVGVIEMRAYQPGNRGAIGESSSIRKWLNEDFYYSINREERERIVETLVINNDNPWYGTNGGNDTLDKIFLLSLDEVVKYFGDSGQLENRFDRNETNIRDKYNKARIAYTATNEYNWSSAADWDWWLRSPGKDHQHAAQVSKSGYIDIEGDYTGTDDGVIFVYGGAGVRPAMWIYE